MCGESGQRRGGVGSCQGRTSGDDTPGNSGQGPNSADRPSGRPGSVERGFLRPLKRNRASRAQPGVEEVEAPEGAGECNGACAGSVVVRGEAVGTGVVAGRPLFLSARRDRDVGECLARGGGAVTVVRRPDGVPHSLAFLGNAGNLREVAEVSEEICVIKGLVGYMWWEALDVLGHQGFRAETGLDGRRRLARRAGEYKVRGTWCRPQTDAYGGGPP
ncbi:hypothetical protein Efla_003581 [Eimeria flavescens]